MRIQLRVYLLSVLNLRHAVFYGTFIFMIEMNIKIYKNIHFEMPWFSAVNK